MQRKYESLRRVWKLDENEEGQYLEIQRGKQKKYRARKKRVSFRIISHKFKFIIKEYIGFLILCLHYRIPER